MTKWFVHFALYLCCYLAGALHVWLIMRARVQSVIAALQELQRLRAARHMEFMERAEREIRELEELIKREEAR